MKSRWMEWEYRLTMWMRFANSSWTRWAVLLKRERKCVCPNLQTLPPYPKTQSLKHLARPPLSPTLQCLPMSPSPVMTTPSSTRKLPRPTTMVLSPAPTAPGQAPINLARTPPNLANHLRPKASTSQTRIPQSNQGVITVEKVLIG